MGLRVLFVGIVDIVGGDEGYVKLVMKLHQSGVGSLLIRKSMVLELQEEVPLPEDLLIMKGRLLRLLVHAPDDVLLHLSCQTGGGSDQSLMIPGQKLVVHPWLIVKALQEGFGAKLHQVLIALVVFAQ